MDKAETNGMGSDKHMFELLHQRSMFQSNFINDKTSNVWEKIIDRDDYHTLPKTNIAPENRPSQKETSIPTIHFRVLC